MSSIASVVATAYGVSDPNTVAFIDDDTGVVRRAYAPRPFGLPFQLRLGGGVFVQARF